MLNTKRAAADESKTVPGKDAPFGKPTAVLISAPKRQPPFYIIQKALQGNFEILAKKFSNAQKIDKMHSLHYLQR